MRTVILWLAQGLGSGRVPFSPGTFGSVVGLLWFAVLLATGKMSVFFGGILLSIPASVWLCSEAEKILGQTDPGSVVIDEIIAIPMSFAGWALILYFNKGIWPGAEYFFSATHWSMTVGVFVLFRIFDIAKPWPVGASQKLPGGWGVTIDDVLAAAYVNIVVVLAYAMKPSWF